MRTLLCAILLVFAPAVNQAVGVEVEPKVIWGHPLHEWSLGISTTNSVFPQGVPPCISLYLSNGANAIRENTVTPDSYSFKIVWTSDSGDILEENYPDSILPRGGSLHTTSVGILETFKVTAWCEDLLARLPPGQGRLVAMRDLKVQNGWEELKSGDLSLRVRPRVESDPPPIPVRPTDKDIIAAGYARQKAAREATNGGVSNIMRSRTSSSIPANPIKSRTPSIVQKSGNAAKPVIGSVSAGESPGSIFTPRNIIGATVVLALLAIIGTVLLRARSRQSPP